MLSLIERILNPWLARERIAESLPPPTPFTITSTSVGPLFFSFSARVAITFVDAKGVAFLGPEKPKDPAVTQAIIFPPASVTLTWVLLNDVLMYTLPRSIFLDFLEVFDLVIASSIEAFSLSALSVD